MVRLVAAALAIAIAAMLGSAGLTVAAAPGPVTSDTVADPKNDITCFFDASVLEGMLGYVNLCDDPASDGGDGDGGEDEASGPSCDLSVWPYVEFCFNGEPCWANVPSPYEEELWPEPHRPQSETAVFTQYECMGSDGEPNFDVGWIDTEDIELPGWGWDAYGQLLTPEFYLSFDPADMTYVGVETSFMVHGLGDGDITGEVIGSTAGPLQATGTLSHVEIDPGDGSGTFNCRPRLRSNECAHVYLQTSQGQVAYDLEDRPSFAVQARLVYDVTFTVDGEETDMPGVPEQLESPWNGTVVPVGEIQVLVD